MPFQNQTAQDDLDTIIQEFVNSGKVFTALHVTVELRERKSPAGILRHMSDISPEVRASYTRGDMGSYQSSLDATGRFNVYHPSGTDPRTANVDIAKVPKPLLPNEVNPNGIKRVSAPGNGYPTVTTVTPPTTGGYPTAVSAPATTTPAPAPATTKVRQGNRYLRSLDGDVAVTRNWKGTGLRPYVEVPREMLRKAGLSHGAAVNLVTENGRVRLQVGSPGVARVQTSRHCLRLTKVMTDAVSVGNNIGVTFTIEGDTIFLS